MFDKASERKFNMIDIRFYQEGDLEPTVALFCKLSAYHLKERASQAPEVRHNLLTNILGDHSGVRLMLAFDGKQAIALATVAILYPAPKETGMLFLKELFTDTEYQGKGVGRKMMAAIAQYAIENNCSRLDWGTNINNTAAIEFYQKLGVPTVDNRISYRAQGDLLIKLANEN